VKRREKNRIKWPRREVVRRGQARAEKRNAEAIKRISEKRRDDRIREGKIRGI